LLEKSFVTDCGIPVAQFAEVNTAGDAVRAGERIGFPGVMKTVRGGYDGKGQWRVESAEQARDAVAQASGAQLIYEQFVPFACEISVVCTRNAAGEIVTYPAAENIHDRGILYMSIVPGRVPSGVAQRASSHAKKIAEALQIVGTFCVEFFVTRQGEVLVNEIAPRPHNSGHYTIDATRCSQYEQHVRAICALPLSEPELLRSAVMVNILGEGTGNHLAGVDHLLRDPNIVLHMYGKRHAVARRKMGHFTMLVNGPVDDAAIERARAARALLHWTQTPEHAAAGR
jgi:5-(carboxyamino)imidazole ribonucleotide synthase